MSQRKGIFRSTTVFTVAHKDIQRFAAHLSHAVHLSVHNVYHGYTTPTSLYINDDLSEPPCILISLPVSTQGQKTLPPPSVPA